MLGALVLSAIMTGDPWLAALGVALYLATGYATYLVHRQDDPVGADTQYHGRQVKDEGDDMDGDFD